MPTTEAERWRYSRIGELDLGAFAPLAAPPTTPPPLDPRGLVAGIQAWSAFVVVRDGWVTEIEIDETAAAAGLSVTRLAVEGDVSVLPEIESLDTDALDHLPAAHAGDPVVVRTKPGAMIADPVVVVHLTETEGGASFPHLAVVAGDDSQVTIYNHHASTDVSALVMPTVDLNAGPAARLSYTEAQVTAQRVWHLGNQTSRIERDATFTTDVVALGGDYARLAIDSTLLGRGGSSRMTAVYFGEGDQMHDFRTLQDHVAPKTDSELLFKGVVQDRSRSVYTGLIHIGKDAAGVDARQTNRNIKLSDTAWAESVPNLEIENNDVRCAHASAIGPVDADQRFYLESRGVPEPVAERLVVLGFFEEVLAGLPVPGAAGPLRDEVKAKLARRQVEA